MTGPLQGAALANSNSQEPISVAPAHKPMTRNERRIYEELRASGAPLKAYAILEKLQGEGIRAPMTVYRALDALIDRGVVKKVTSLNAFAAVQDDATQSTGAFVTCRRCGQTREVSLGKALISQLLAPAGMAVEDVFIEAYGECRKPDHCVPDS